MDESLGLELWRAVANVRAWGETPAEGRAGLFARASAAENTDLQERRAYARVQAPELVPALATFAALTSTPQLVEQDDVVGACRLVVEWATERNMLETAMQFAEAAAAVDPASAALANLAGRCCREARERARAEVWYDRGIGLARNAQDVPEYIAGHLGFGGLLLSADETADALPYFRRAAFTAKRFGMEAQAAESFHDICAACAFTGDLGRATVYARRAMHFYPRHHKRYPYFVCDVAFLAIRRGAYLPALSLLVNGLRKISNVSDQLQVWGTIAKAAAGAGLRDRFTEAASRVKEMAASYPSTGAAALCNVADGARLLEDWDTAERFAAAALSYGDQTGAAAAVRVARELLTEIAERRPGVPPASRDDPATEVIRRLMPILRQRLRRWRGPTWRPRRQGGPGEAGAGV